MANELEIEANYPLAIEKYQKAAELFAMESQNTRSLEQQCLLKVADLMCISQHKDMEKNEYDDKGNVKSTEQKVDQVNSASALWKRPKSELKTEDYNEFYKTISHDGQDPLHYVHTHAEEKIKLEERIIEVLKTVYDPEIPVDVYNLGLIYRIELSDEGNLEVDMTLTAPNCPAADFIAEDVRLKLAGIEGINDVKLELVFEPEWDKDMMSEEAKLELGFL